MRFHLLLGSAMLALWSSVGTGAAAEVKLLLPLQRKAYQTNERIDLAVVRSGDKELAGGELVLKVCGEDGSALTFTFPVKKANGGRAVAHLHLNGWLLRPGKYTVEVHADSATAATDIEVYSHIRRSSFRLINWGRAKGKQEQLPQGEDCLGYNLFYGHYGQDEEGNFIRAGVDFMSNCTMGGGHQMDLRQECDWSDPLVVRGGTRRVVRRAFMDRSRGNVPGVHFYDEPGLTWLKHPVTGENTPHDIPSQVRSYEAAFGRKPLPYNQVDPKNPEHVRRWAHWAHWKLGFMDAAWRDAQFGVSYVRPDYLSVTQSQYGFGAFTDGYYFNVVRSLPVISGHGGYHDFGPGYFNPSLFLEFARARDFSRPNWYLPTWYGSTTADQYRLEQYLSFQTNIQGMMSPPDLEPGTGKSKALAAIVETNHLMGRLGPIFTTMPVERPPVALLYSLSQFIKKQTEDRNVNYAHATAHGRNTWFTYLAGKLMQQPIMVVLDEDVRDGTLAAHHKAIVLTSLDYLDPQVIAGLEDFAKGGGLVLLTADCTVNVKGAKRLAVTPGFPEAAKIAELTKAGKNKEAAQLTHMRQALQGAQKLADAIKPHLERAGIDPVFGCSEPGIVATRQSAGDIEYLFAVNATHDPTGDPMLGMKAVTARIGIDAGLGRAVYDAVRGGPVPEFGGAKVSLDGKFRFGAGQMRVFARTARPIGGVKSGTPVLRRDYTQQEAPIRLELAAVLLDNKGGLLSGSAPLRVRVLDPLGGVRYDLFRATDRGTLTLSLPLALNDPAGKWTVKVSELLNNTEDTATFSYPAVAVTVPAAGATRRAVFLAQDRDNVFRFFRVHHKLTVVKGAGDYDEAAKRLAQIVKPWNVECTIVKAADVNRARSLTEEETKTWSGLHHTGRGSLKPGDKNDPAQVGFAVQGPVVLLGTPQDNPLIKVLADQRFLPYTPVKGEMPGPGRGYLAWQRDAIGVLQESLTLIAHDAAGMAEAVGTLYELLAGIDPLTPLALPRAGSVTPASKSTALPAAKVSWSAAQPGGVVGLKALGGKLSVLTQGGVLTELNSKGVRVAPGQVLGGDGYAKAAARLSTPVSPSAVAAAQKTADPRRQVKFVVPNGQLTAVAYWGGTVHLVDKGGAVRAEHRGVQDVTALTWWGEQLVVGDADGWVTVLVVNR